MRNRRYILASFVFCKTCDNWDDRTLTKNNWDEQTALQFVISKCSDQNESLHFMIDFSNDFFLLFENHENCVSLFPSHLRVYFITSFRRTLCFFPSLHNFKKGFDFFAYRWEYTLLQQRNLLQCGQCQGVLLLIANQRLICKDTKIREKEKE